MRRMEETGRPHVWLDARGFDDQMWPNDSPTSWSRAASTGLTRGPISFPLCPRSTMCPGGLLTDVNGRTSIQGLFAVGESVPARGVHGANRLASNSPALEGLVFADRLARCWQGVATSARTSAAG